MLLYCATRIILACSPSTFPPALPRPDCSLMAVYCCQGPDEVTPFIPEQPPSPAPETVVGVESIHQLQPGGLQIL